VGLKQFKAPVFRCAKIDTQKTFKGLFKRIWAIVRKAEELQRQ